MGLLIAYLLGLLTPLSKKNDPAKDSEKEAAQDKKHRLPNLPPSEVRLPPSQTDEERAKEKKRSTREAIKFWVEMIGVVILLIYTAATVATYLQIKDQFRADQRAWIAATVYSSEPQIGQPFEITLKMKNTGKTTAVNARICAVTEFVHKPFTLPHPSECRDEDWRVPSTIPPVGDATLPSFVVVDGGRQNGIEPRVPLLTKEQFISLGSGDMAPILHGTIAYSDIFGCRHWTMFCQIRRLTNGQGTWQVCDSKNSNSTDTGYECQK